MGWGWDRRRKWRGDLGNRELTFMLQRAAEASWSPWLIECAIFKILGLDGWFRGLEPGSGDSSLECRRRCSYTERGRRRNLGS